MKCLAAPDILLRFNVSISFIFFRFFLIYYRLCLKRV